jgi:hypothetical protein
MEEIWKPVPSYPGIEASSLGRIRRAPYTKPMPHGGFRIYSGQPTYGCKARSTCLAGFRMIYRYRGLGKTLKVHRLVCEAFHGAKPFGDAVVMHIDDNPMNNKPDNLKWGSQKENLNSRQFIDYCKSKAGISARNLKGVNQYTKHNPSWLKGAG